MDWFFLPGFRQLWPLGRDGGDVESAPAPPTLSASPRGEQDPGRATCVPICRGIYYAKYYGKGGGKWPAGEKKWN